MPTPSPEKIQSVLKDLYELDPALRAYGAELEKAIATILAARPDVNINQQFAATLRHRLTSSSPQPATPSSFMQSPFMKKITSYVLLPIGAIAAIAIIAAVVTTRPELLRMFKPGGSQPASPTTIAFANGVKVTQENANAFGNLASANAPMAMWERGEADVLSSTKGAGGGIGMAPATPVMPPTANGTAVADMTKISEPGIGMIAPDYTYERLRYTYDGPELKLESQGSVYRRIKRGLNAADLGSVLSRLSLGIMDLARFGSVNLQQFSLIQPGEYGYQINVDMIEGNVNINQNWSAWPRVNCLSATVSAEDLRMPCSGARPEDVPEDAALIAITDAFLAEHGISKEGFGAPMVDRRWGMAQPMIKSEAGATGDAARIMYVPDSVAVMYPLQLDGATINDQSGFPFGLSVSVDVRSKRVSNVWNLTTHEYQASSYDLVTDVKQILDIASRGDVYSTPFGQDPNERIRDLKLGEPTRVLMQSWRQKDDSTGEEIYVPALRFPVIPDADGYVGYRDAVIIPLVKDLIEPAYTIMYGSGGTTDTAVKATPPPAPMEPVTLPAPAPMR